MKIENYNKNLDEEELARIIKESEKFDETDSLKYKYHKLLNKLNEQVDNLRYNYESNEYINLDDSDKGKIGEHLCILVSKLNDIKSKYNYDLDNNSLLDLVNSLKKLLKVNESKYSMLISNYDNNSSNLVLEKSNLEEINFKLDEYNNLIQSYMNDKIDNLGNISKFTKDNLMSYFNNLLYKLNSINLDEEGFNKYKRDIDSIIEKYVLNDIELINSYGNINSIKELFKVNNINYDITKFYNLNSLDIFNLLYDISLQYNLKI